MLRVDRRNQGADQGNLFFVIQAELARTRINQFELPGEQGEALVECPQCFAMQPVLWSSAAQHYVYLLRECSYFLKPQGACSHHQALQRGHQALRRIGIIANQLKVDQALIQLAKQGLGHILEFIQRRGPLIIVQHAWLHSGVQSLSQCDFKAPLV
jgi:hypothetical protein